MTITKRAIATFKTGDHVKLIRIPFWLCLTAFDPKQIGKVVGFRNNGVLVKFRQYNPMEFRPRCLAKVMKRGWK